MPVPWQIAMITEPSPLRPIRVFVVDGQDLYRLGLRFLVSTTTDLTLVGEAGSPAEASLSLDAQAPDVVVWGLDPCEEALEWMSRLVRPSSQLLVVDGTGSKQTARAAQALRRGAHGLVTRDVSGDSLLRAIRAVGAGQSWTPKAPADDDPAGPASVVPTRAAPAALTPRERELLALLAEGLANNSIAAQLNVSAKTVRNQLSVIYDKLGVNDRMSCLIHALQNGLTRVPENRPPQPHRR